MRCIIPGGCDTQTSLDGPRTGALRRPTAPPDRRAGSVPSAAMSLGTARRSTPPRRRSSTCSGPRRDERPVFDAGLRHAAAGRAGGRPRRPRRRARPRRPRCGSPSTRWPPSTAARRATSPSRTSPSPGAAPPFGASSPTRPSSCRSTGGASPSPLDLVDEAMARLADGSDGAGDWLATCTEADRAEVRALANERVATFLECFPPLQSAVAARHRRAPAAPTCSPDGSCSPARPTWPSAGPRAPSAGKVVIDLKTGGVLPHPPRRPALLRPGRDPPARHPAPSHRLLLPRLGHRPARGRHRGRAARGRRPHRRRHPQAARARRRHPRARGPARARLPLVPRPRPLRTRAGPPRRGSTGPSSPTASSDLDEPALERVDGGLGRLRLGHGLHARPGPSARRQRSSIDGEGTAPEPQHHQHARGTACPPPATVACCTPITSTSHPCSSEPIGTASVRVIT